MNPSNNDNPSDHPLPEDLHKKAQLFFSKQDDYHSFFSSSDYTETEYCTQPTIVGGSTANKNASLVRFDQDDDDYEFEDTTPIKEPRFGHH